MLLSQSAFRANELRRNRTLLQSKVEKYYGAWDKSAKEWRDVTEEGIR